MSVSIIIPTYNRSEVLRKTLDAYAAQTGDHRILELLVVDDGSRDDTRSVVEQCTLAASFPIRYIYQENRGLAAARNHGIREASGELLLFGDDDIIPTPGMVAKHTAWHQEYPDANLGLLGYVIWAPDVRPTPFMMWSGLYGPQFQFGTFKPGMELKYWHAYFCNTSVKAGFLAQNQMFNEIFQQYGWEDVEMSYRLYEEGFRMFYEPAALGHHYKYETFADTLRRVRKANQSMAVFATTDAGRCYIRQVHSTPRVAASRSAKEAAKGLLRPLRAPLMRLLRWLADTRIPLPSKVYSRVFFYYVNQRPQGLHAS
jgi:glycosyltransferase involved in cell wall biosynthesis